MLATDTATLGGSGVAATTAAIYGTALPFSLTVERLATGAADSRTAIIAFFVKATLAARFGGTFDVKGDVPDAAIMD